MSLDVYLVQPMPVEVYEDNITHNLGAMAKRAGCYYILWRPEEVGIRRAKQLIAPLKDALRSLRDNPELYEQDNPENGWGDYDALVAFVERYLSACEDTPDAEVVVSR